MLSKELIIELLTKLNKKLKMKQVKGEIGIVGGAAMCLAYSARGATKDVDAVFAPSSVVRLAAEELATEEGLPSDWLNDGVKGFLVEGFTRETILTLSNLSVWVPNEEYMLAMKCMSARQDSKDRDDVEFLINRLGVKTVEDTLDVVGRYYPKSRIPQKTIYFLEEIFEMLSVQQTANADK
jgi:hypothetical protein